jgi:aconitate hydratase
MAAASKNSFGARDTLTAGNQSYEVYRLGALERRGIGHVKQLPFSIRILLENLLRQEDGRFVHAKDIEALAEWQPVAEKRAEIAFMPARVLLQDFTGVPAVADLAAMRDAIARMGGDAKKINPLLPAELVIDHSVQVDQFGSNMAFAFNAQMEFQRNVERYEFLRWGQNAFQNFAVVPPDTGICHQVNLEYLARVVCDRAPDGRAAAYPDSLVGTDSHTTMVNEIGRASCRERV